MSIGCDDCRYYTGHRCELWEVAVPDPCDSHCDSVRPWLPSADVSTKLTNVLEQGPARSHNYYQG